MFVLTKEKHIGFGEKRPAQLSFGEGESIMECYEVRWNKWTTGF